MAKRSCGWRGTKQGRRRQSHTRIKGGALVGSLALTLGTTGKRGSALRRRGQGLKRAGEGRAHLEVVTESRQEVVVAYTAMRAEDRLKGILEAELVSQLCWMPALRSVETRVLGGWWGHSGKETPFQGQVWGRPGVLNLDLDPC